MLELNQELAGMKILIVDDTPANVDVLRKILTHHGFNISMAPSGEIALKIVSKIQPDLIVLDVMMPGINGFETCQKLKSDKSTQDIPVIFITAKIDANDIVEGFSAGGIDYITKPFSLEEVLVRIETQLKLSKTTKDLKKAILATHDAKEDSLAKSEFLSRMSHELKTPLNSVLGFSQLLEMSQDPPLTTDQKKQVDQITGAGRYLLKLIGEVLDVTDLDSGNFKILSEKVDLLPLIEEAMTAVIPDAKKYNVTLINNTKDSDTYFVRGESKRIKQILENILLNAIKYNKETGTVTLELTKDTEWVTISITDTGEGIPQEHLEEIFVPLFRLEKHKTLVGGVGMGLTTAKKLTQLMGGKIKATSKLNEGSCFSVHLPVMANN